MALRDTKLITLSDRLAKLASKLRAQAERMPPGPHRDALLKKAKHADAATHRADWIDTLRP